MRATAGNLDKTAPMKQTLELRESKPRLVASEGLGKLHSVSGNFDSIATCEKSNVVELKSEGKLGIKVCG